MDGCVCVCAWASVFWKSPEVDVAVIESLAYSTCPALNKVLMPILAWWELLLLLLLLFPPDIMLACRAQAALLTLDQRGFFFTVWHLADLNTFFLLQELMAQKVEYLPSPAGVAECATSQPPCQSRRSGRRSAQREGDKKENSFYADKVNALCFSHARCSSPCSRSHRGHRAQWRHPQQNWQGVQLPGRKQL